MTTYVAAALRRLVSGRAEGLCEYCLIHEDDSFFGCQVEHVISEKHGGLTVPENLAYACVFCNRYKGSDIGSVSASGQFVRFFNPRTDRWSEHFGLDGPRIKALTDVGEATVRILRINDAARIMERQTLMAVDHYPSAAARSRMNA